MVDTVRTESALQTLYADNTAGDIGAQDLRDGLVSMWTPGWVRYLDHRLPSETAHADDDFFKDGTKTGITETTVTGSATWTESNGILGAVFDDQSSNDAAVALKALTPSAAPVTIETAFDLAALSIDFTSVGICFTDGTTATDNVALFRIVAAATAGSNVYRVSAGTLTNFIADVNTQVGASSYPLSSVPMGLLYVRLAWTAANTFGISLSSNGVSWTGMGASTFAKTMTPTHFGPFVSTSGGTTPLVAGFHYLRVYESNLT